MGQVIDFTKGLRGGLKKSELEKLRLAKSKLSDHSETSEDIGKQNLYNHRKFIGKGLEECVLEEMEKAHNKLQYLKEELDSDDVYKNILDELGKQMWALITNTKLTIYTMKHGSVLETQEQVDNLIATLERNGQT